MKRYIIPIAPIDRLIRNAGAKRVSQDAGEKLAEILEGIAIDLSRQAIVFAHHAGRCTVTGQDFDAVVESRKGSQKF